MKATIYPNPRCSKSRATLALIEETGIKPTIVLYLNDPPTSEKLLELLSDMRLTARNLLRTKGALYSDLGLADGTLGELDLVNVMVQHPELIDRPIVVTERGVRLCRPPETVFEIIDAATI